MGYRLASAFIATISLCPACADTHKTADTGSSPAAEGKAHRSPTGRADKKNTDNVPSTLVRTVEMETFGAQPGYLSGGLLYASIRVDEAQRWWHSIPKSSEMRRDGGELAREIGFDLVAGNWAEYFHLDPTAVISATILRPIDGDIDLVRKAVETDTGSRKALVNNAFAALGFHTRLHVPSKDPAKTRAALLGFFKDNHRSRGARACADFTTKHCALSSSGELVVFRETAGSVTIDFLVFAARHYELAAMGLVTETELSLLEIASRRAVAMRAVAETTAQVSNAENLAGDAAVWIDPTVLGRLAAIEKLGTAHSFVGDEDPESSGYHLKALSRIEGLLTAPRLFPGVGISLDYVDDDLFGEAVWPVAGALWGRLAVRTVSTKASSVPVPKVPALCKGTLTCFRTQALPDPSPISKRLLTNGFAEKFEDVVEAMDRDEEYGLTLLLAGAWPNLLASALNAPESFKGTEAGIARTVRDAVMHADGYGGQLQSYTWGGWGPASADWTLYARAAKQDIEAAKGLLSLGGLSTKDLELPAGQGPATTLELADGRMGAHALFQTGEEEYGWATLASSPRLSLPLLTMESEMPTGPMAYLEFPDLWALLSPAFGSDGDILPFQSWLDGRRLQFVLELDAGQPHLRAALTQP